MVIAKLIMLKPFFIKRLILVSVLCSVSLLGLAQTISFSGEENLGAAQGLPNDTVFSLVQDELGFVWAGTPSGIGILDGYEIRQYSAGEGPIVANYSPGNLYLDAANTIWVGTWGRGLYYIPQDRRQILPFRSDITLQGVPLSNQKIQSILQSKSGELWIGTFDHGLLAVSEDGSYRHFHTGGEAGANLLNDRVWSLAEDNLGNIWIGTSSGLSKYNVAEKTITHFFSDANLPTADKLIRTLLPVGDYIWVGTNLGLFRIHRVTAEIENMLPESIETLAVNRIRSDGKTGLWIATFNGLYHYELLENQFSRFSNEEYGFKVSYDVRDVLVGDDGLLLLATRFSGVITLNSSPKSIRNIQSQSAIEDSKNHIFSIATDKWGALWSGTNNGLVVYEYDSGNRVELPDALSEFEQGRITATISRNDGREIWFGTSDNLYSYDVEQQRLTSHLDVFEGESINHIQRLLEDSQGNLWVTVSHQGVYQITPDNSVMHYHRRASGNYRIPPQNVVQLIEDFSGNILMLLEDLQVLKRSTYSPVFESIDLQLDTLGMADLPIVTTLGVTHQGTIWVGSYSGLLYFPQSERSQAQLLTVEDGLVSNDIRAIIEDEYHQIWVSSGNGLTLMDRQGNVVRTFTQKDGLSSNSLNLRSAFNCAGDAICMGSNAGINVLQSAKIKESSRTPNVVVTNLWINNQLQEDPVTGSGNISLQLTETQRNIRFQFADVDHDPNADSVLYYKLHGFDESWQVANVSRIAQYTNLEPADYIFQVSNQPFENLPPGHAATVNFEIIPPFWQRPMTQFVSIVSLIILMIFTYRLRISQIRKKETQLNKLVNVRTSNMAVLSTIGMEITRSTSFEEIFERLKHHLKTVMYENKFMLGIVDEQEEVLNFDLVIHEAVKLQGFTISLSEFTHPAVWSYQHQKEVMADAKSEASPFYRHIQEQECTFVACIPLRVDKNKLGVIYLQANRSDAFGDYEREFLRTIAAYTSIALKNAQYYEQEKDLQLQRISWLENITHYLNHEMKNAIIGAQTSLSMMRRKTEDDGLLKYVSRAERSHQEMRSIMDAVSDTTSMEAAIMTAELHTINVSQVLEQRLMEYRHIYKDINIVGEVEPDIGVIGNEDLIVQCLDKLVNNAIEHHEKNSAIRVKLVTVKSQCQLSVKNIGDALPEDKDFIFGLFTSTKSSSSEGNYGMGLYIVRLIAELHKGKVTVDAIDSEDITGAIFTITMPMYPLAESGS